MDKNPPPPGSAAAQTWQWLPEQMPGITKLMREKRRQLGDAWVNECWKHGVRNGEPGWFFAAEGSLMVGALGDETNSPPEVVQQAQAWLTGKVFRTQALLFIRTPGATDGPR
jgi:hypothetical protein